MQGGALKPVAPAVCISYTRELMTNTVFQAVLTDTGALLGRPVPTLREAVLEAARYDGWGALFERMDYQGFVHKSFPMRLFSSKGFLGNNAYLPLPQDAFSTASSTHPDDTVAQDEVAAQVLAAGVLHSKYRLSVDEFTFDDKGTLQAVNGKPLAGILEGMQNMFRESNGDNFGALTGAGAGTRG